jgi:hypothetical protein
MTLTATQQAAADYKPVAHPALSQSMINATQKFAGDLVVGNYISFEDRFKALPAEDLVNLTLNEVIAHRVRCIIERNRMLEAIRSTVSLGQLEKAERLIRAISYYESTIAAASDIIRGSAIHAILAAANTYTMEPNLSTAASIRAFNAIVDIFDGSDDLADILDAVGIDA